MSLGFKSTKSNMSAGWRLPGPCLPFHSRCFYFPSLQHCAALWTAYAQSCFRDTALIPSSWETLSSDVHFSSHFIRVSLSQGGLDWLAFHDVETSFISYSVIYLVFPLAFLSILHNHTNRIKFILSPLLPLLMYCKRQSGKDFSILHGCNQCLDHQCQVINKQL